MIVKSCFRHVFRTPIKTTLFLFLLAAVTVFLCLGISMWLSVTESLESVGHAFRTIGVIEYRNPLNSNIKSHNGNYDYSPIYHSEYVELFDQRTLLPGFSEAITISQAINPGKSGLINSVIEFTPVEILRDGELVLGRVLKVLHSYDPLVIEGEVILIEIRAEDECYLELGKTYITSMTGKIVFPFMLESDLRSFGLLDIEEPFEAIMEITEEDYLKSGSGQLWAHLIEKYKNSLHTSTVYTTNDLETMLIFHQNNAIVTSGRTFSKTDYEEGNRVCLISTSLAQINGLQLGDSISIAFSEALTYISRGSTMYVDSQNHLNIFEEGNYEIIGLYQTVGNISGAYGLLDETIFIPQKSICFQPVNYITRDNFVSFRLTNGTVEAFLAEMEQYDLTGISFTFYDQGYAKITTALADMKQTALVLTAICASAGLGIVLLFALLFVGKQKRNIAVMYALGTSRPKLFGFLLVTVLIVSGFAASIGGIAGHVLSDTILTGVYTRNLEEQTQAAYSGVYGSDVEADFQINSPNGPIAPVAAAGSVLTLTLLLSSLFAIKVLKAEPMQVLTAKED